MTMITKQTAVPLWHYRCPECGIGDEDTGYHGPTHMLHCEVCLEEGNHVRLKRWQVEPDGSGTLTAGGLGRG